MFENCFSIGATCDAAHSLSQLGLNYYGKGAYIWETGRYTEAMTSYVNYKNKPVRKLLKWDR